MSVEQLKEAATAGAYIELTYYSLLGSEPRSPTPAMYAQLIKAIGAEHFILSSDLGREQSPVHTAGWKAYLEMLLKAGVSQREIDLMARRNPALFLGLQ
jgi:predicted metal-dependent TIM-barrel fold hydrolase